MENLHHFIGESYPYLFTINNLIIKESTLEHTSSINPLNSFKEFNTILQTASSLGSLSLLKTMNISSKTFFLGEKSRIRKIHTNSIGPELKYCAKSLLFSKRNGKSLVDIFNHHNQLAYTFELDYVIFSEESFHRVFKDYYAEKVPITNTPLTDYKEVALDLISPSYFKVNIKEFSNEQCAGHFDHYPIVPAVFIVNRLLEAIEQFFKLQGELLQSKTLLIDSLEIFPNKAIPTYTELNSLVYYRQIAKDSYLFVCSLNDHQTEYGNYIITVKINPLPPPRE
ncbi:hypothetical protein [Myroides odoratus]|uniref:hypothetical protein n=1 Tax=Myroides odoratus TaxID=256 RepID=UPI0039B096A9